jgi:hypothetical protein
MATHPPRRETVDRRHQDVVTAVTAFGHHGGRTMTKRLIGLDGEMSDSELLRESPQIELVGDVPRHHPRE